MKPQLLLFKSLFLILVYFLSLSLAHAQVKEARVMVKGMSCPFCAFGVEKKLKEIEGVDSAKTNLKDGLVVLLPKKGENMEINEIPKAVKNSGFTAGEIHITAVGTLKKDEKNAFVFHVPDSKQVFLITGSDGEISNQLLSFVETGKNIEITGSLKNLKDERIHLIPEKIHAPANP